MHFLLVEIHPWLCQVPFAYCTFCLPTKNSTYLPIPCCSRTFWYLLQQVYFWIECLTLGQIPAVSPVMRSVSIILPHRLFLVFLVVFHYGSSEELLASLLLRAYLFLYVLRIFSFNFCSFCERNLEYAFKWKVLLCDWEHKFHSLPVPWPLYSGHWNPFCFQMDLHSAWKLNVVCCRRVLALFFSNYISLYCYLNATCLNILLVLYYLISNYCWKQSPYWDLLHLSIHANEM